ncbi:hypothetical protein B0H16DRAFT_1734039 [Mycena metata]|uniref:Uncharacterized protein n=1 Tax=Mycena metata TaxID=1033252 RepID=A0AAD7MRD7_9AGAR|nr:hypothetical protein B0H16DRAFT_1734039 [Mycena metata]
MSTPKADLQRGERSFHAYAHNPGCQYTYTVERQCPFTDGEAVEGIHANLRRCGSMKMGLTARRMDVLDALPRRRFLPLRVRLLQTLPHGLALTLSFSGQTLTRNSNTKLRHGGS